MHELNPLALDAPKHGELVYGGELCGEALGKLGRLRREYKFELTTGMEARRAGG